MKVLCVRKMIISKVKKHDYIIMFIEFSVRGQVSVTMVDYLKGLISSFEEVEILTGTSVSQAIDHLYTIR